MSKIKRLGYFPQYVIENNVFDDSFAIISVTDINGEKPEINSTKNVLRLEFLDFEDPVKDGFDNEMIADGIVFNNNYAEQIIHFIDNLNNVNTIVVHCRMGVSRSAAISLCLAQYLKEKNMVSNDFFFQGEEQAVHANKLIVSTFNKHLKNPVKIPTKEEAQAAAEASIILINKMFKPLP